jgi:hypothetical protein
VPSWSSRQEVQSTESEICQDVRPKTYLEPQRPNIRQGKQQAKERFPKSFSADPTVDVIDSRRNTRPHSRQGDAWFVTLGSTGDANMSLQEAFERNRLGVKERIRQRAENIHAKVQKRKDLIDHLFKTKQHPYMHPPLEQQNSERRKKCTTDIFVKMRRVFTHKEMRKQTERMYRKLPEVNEREVEKDMQDFKKTHQIMKAVYTDRVKKETLKGKVDFPITQNFLVC